MADAAHAGSWAGLAQEFRALDAPLGESRLERQWDDASEEWRISGRADLETTRRFREAAARAGALLDAAAGEKAESVWFRHLWEQGGPHAPPMVGMMSMHGRASAGHVSIGRIQHPARVSADLAAKLAATG